MSSKKPIASLSLDLDNKWTYMKTHGDAGWESFPSFLDIVVPRILKILAARGLKITFFIVGQDAALEKNRAALEQIAAAGHEIANHSFSHEPWLQRYPEQRIEMEIADAGEHIKRVTGHQPRGFRGPGFSFSDATLTVLARHGYNYDASTFPTFIGPFARAYYFMVSRLTKSELQERKELFGSFKDVFRPLRPYCWEFENGNLIEIPVSTMPIFRVPFHLSYVLYLSSFSPTLARCYFRTALLLCRLTDTQPSLLLHSLDFIGCDDTSDLSFFPAMKLTSTQKMRTVCRSLDQLLKHFESVTMYEHSLTTALKIGRSGHEEIPNRNEKSTPLAAIPASKS
jgi:peptidoglycan-N-acetylglucosamine deacetylase